jgi:hypothetical protein
MQVFEPREPDDFSLIYNIVPEKEKLAACEKYTQGIEKGACWKIGWKNKYKEFCDAFPGDVRYACFREAWVINDDKIKSAEGIINYCSYTDDPAEKKKCYNKLVYGLMATFDFDVEKMKPICSNLPAGIKDQCFANTASRLIETDKNLIDQSLAICAYAAKLGVAGDCYDELSYYSSFLFASSSPEFTKLCNGLPTDWRAKCLTRQRQ